MDPRRLRPLRYAAASRRGYHRRLAGQSSYARQRACTRCWRASGPRGGLRRYARRRGRGDAGVSGEDLSGRHMAMNPRQSGYTRDDVVAWFEGFAGTRAEARARILERLGDDKDLLVNTSAFNGRAPATPLVDLILDDLPSYGFNVTSS